MSAEGVSLARPYRTTMDPFSVVVEEEDDSGERLAEGVGSLSSGTFRAFVAALLLAQGGLFAASLGLLLAGFRGQLLLGGGLFVGGTVALVATAGIVRWHGRRDRPQEE
jgi:hypothetical protein